MSTTEIDAIRKRARADLIVMTDQGDSDVFLWEHSVRVAHSAQQIAKLPEVVPKDADQDALVAAALYHDAGWVIGCREGRLDRRDILLSPLPGSAWGQAASLLEARLAPILQASSLRRATIAVREMGKREPESIEGRILVEANNLDEFGVTALWPAIRRGFIEGKGVQAVIDTWRRKKEYQFWSARVKDSFRFPTVRKHAERRLKRLERFMRELEEQQQGLDVTPIAVTQSGHAAAQPKKKLKAP